MSEYEVHVLKTENKKLQIICDSLKAENAKLCEQIMQLQADWESERDYANQMEAKEKQAVAENAKLRDLVRAAWGCVKGHVSCDECRMVAGGCTLKSAMKAAGIEVER